MPTHDPTYLRVIQEKQKWAVRLRGSILLGLIALYLGLVLVAGVPFTPYFLPTLLPLFVVNEVRRHRLSRGQVSKKLLQTSLILDQLTIVSIVYFTGGVESFMVPFLVVQVAATALHVNFRVGLSDAVLGTLLFAVACLAEFAGILPHSPLMTASGHAHHCLNGLYLMGAVVFVGFTLVVAACSSGFVARKLRVREEELAQANRQLDRLLAETRRLSLTDELTGAFNRRYLGKRLDEEVVRARRYGRPLSLLMLDIDHFKSVNDDHGHPAGDAVLREVVQRIGKELRQVDLVARYGGEEFAVVLPETPLEGGRLVAERVRERVARTPMAIPGGKLSVTISVGVSHLDSTRKGEDRDPAQLFEQADMRLYRAKRGGRNRVVSSEVPEDVSSTPGGRLASADVLQAHPRSA